MSKWTAKLILLFLLIWVLLGVWIWFGGSPSNIVIRMVNLVIPTPLNTNEPRTFSELSSTYPEPIAVFLYTFEKWIIVYIGLVLVAILMVIFCVGRVMKIMWQSPELAMADPEPVQVSLRGWQEKFIAFIGLIRKRGFFPLIHNLGLGWNMAVKPAVMILMIGLLIIGVVYDWTVNALRKQSDDRAFAVATNVIDWAATHKLQKDDPALQALLASYAASREVAYIFVEDGAGDVLVHSLASFPPELRGTLSGTEAGHTTETTVIFKDEKVFETRIPSPESQIGAVHVGIWMAARDKEIRRAILPLIAIMFVILLIGAMILLWFMLKLSRPIIQLSRVADRLSKGDLDTPISTASRDEIGDLALSLERMRSSLKASIELLYRQRSKENKQKRNSRRDRLRRRARSTTWWEAGDALHVRRRAGNAVFRL